jgi:hypothetical protein
MPELPGWFGTNVDSSPTTLTIEDLDECLKRCYDDTARHADDADRGRRARGFREAIPERLKGDVLLLEVANQIWRGAVFSSSFVERLWRYVEEADHPMTATEFIEQAWGPNA